MAKSIRRRIIANKIVYWTIKKVDAQYKLEKYMKKYKNLIKEDKNGKTKNR